MTPIHDVERCYLKLNISFDKVQFYYAIKQGEWIAIGPTFNFGQLGDEFNNKLGFTGAYAGLCAQDLSAGQKYADFDFFKYSEVIK